MLTCPGCMHASREENGAPVPSTLMSATLSMVAKPFTMTGPVRSTSVWASLITVPARAALGVSPDCPAGTAACIQPHTE